MTTNYNELSDKLRAAARKKAKSRKELKEFYVKIRKYVDDLRVKEFVEEKDERSAKAQ